MGPRAAARDSRMIPSSPSRHWNAMRALPLLSPLSLLLAACTQGVILTDTGLLGQPVGTEADADTDADTDADSDADTDADTDSDVEDVGGPDDISDYPEPCADLYNPQELPTFGLDFEPSTWNALKSACSSYSQAYFPVEFTYEGETVPAQVRLKGNWSWNCQKMQFIVSFNEEDPDARFHGLRKVMLDAPWYDHTLLHERIAYPLFKARGLPYSCANNARVEVNGEYYGLYANLERIDHEYLERHFEDPSGNLYQGGAELKTNEDVGDTSRLTALNSAGSADEIAELADLDQAVAEWAMEAMIPAMDNYWAGVEINYYLYDHPENGFTWLPYDLDISFGDSAYSDGSLIWSNVDRVDPITYEHSGWKKEAVALKVLGDPYWCGRFVEELEAARAVYDPEELAAQVDEWNAQILDSLEEDDNKTFSDARHDIAVDSLKAFFGKRADFVDAWLAEGGHCP